MLYSRIAESLQEISGSPQAQKVQVAAALLEQASLDILCPVVRLICGELWPRWEAREMGIGPETLAAALAEVSDLPLSEISHLREAGQEMGVVAEAALARKRQNSLLSEPLLAQSVYDALRQISRQSGRDSDQRKASLLRGLFLQATPLEGRFIARAALRGIRARVGPKTMISAVATALRCDKSAVFRAYSLLPDLGLVADAARKGEMEKIVMLPGIPVGFMLYARCKGRKPSASDDSSSSPSPSDDRGLPSASHPPYQPTLSSALPSTNQPQASSAFLPVYPGLRVQVHKSKRDVFVFSSQLRPITYACIGPVREIAEIDADFILDAYLIGFRGSGDVQGQGQDSTQIGRICSQREMLRYINRRRFSRKSSLTASLLAYDLLFLDGENLCSLPYQERRKSLTSILGEPKEMPFTGAAPAKEQKGTDVGAAEDISNNVREKDIVALLIRDLRGRYQPGEVSSGDCMIRCVK